MSLVLFHARVYALEVARPPAIIQAQLDHFTRELDRINAYFNENRFIYQYLREELTFLDDRLFSRANVAHILSVEFTGIEMISYTTRTFGHIVASFKANDMLSAHILQVIDALKDTGPTRPAQKNIGLIWTESKTGLIELAYALQSAGCFNDSKADLRQVVEVLQKAFNIDLGNYPRTFQEILARKTGYTNFIDKLRHHLLLRIQSIEDR